MSQITRRADTYSALHYVRLLHRTPKFLVSTLSRAQRRAYVVPAQFFPHLNTRFI